ncbi:MAG: peptidoglycan editing factor PgeF [Parcubacteria group bacterium]|jgi:hypothetical protein
MIKFFKNKKDILAVMSEKDAGSMKLLKNDINEKNRNNFFKDLGIDKNNVFSAEIVHSDKVEIVDNDSPKIIKGADSLITRRKVFLAVTIADCIPVYFYDEKNKVIGLAHAGWRGIADGIIKNTLNKMLTLGATAIEINIIMGPGIRDCHFEVDNDVAVNFKNYSEFIFKKENKIFINLFGIINKESLDFGIKKENISDYEECTFENSNKYFSYRRDNPKIVEAMIAIMGMRDN